MATWDRSNRAVVLATSDESDEPLLNELLEPWHALRDGRTMPVREDMTPERLKSHLGWIHLLAVSHEPLEFHFRLYGSKIADVLGHDASGKSLTETFSGDFRGALRDAFVSVVNRKEPLVLKSTGAGAGKEHLDIISLLLPLADKAKGADKVDVILIRHVIGDYR